MMNIKIMLYILLFSVPVLACGKGKGSGIEAHDPPPRERPIRVLGYLFSDNNWVADLEKVRLGQITDLNLAFINPEASGSFTAPAGLTQLVEKVHAAGGRVFISIGGGNPPAHLALLLADGAGRDKLVSGLLAFAETHQFDGVDVDLENTLINEHYAPFVNKLATALHGKGKLITAALASWNSDQVDNVTLRTFDFINIMSYDKTGPWNPDNAGPHAPYSMVTDDFNYYHQTRGIDAEKLFIGLPFYGYGFGGNAPESIFYSDLIRDYPLAETTDQVAVEGGGTIYYNGIPTIRQKVEFALGSKAGGVMIWQLLHDSNDDKSLLKAIDDTINEHISITGTNE